MITCALSLFFFFFWIKHPWIKPSDPSYISCIHGLLVNVLELYLINFGVVSRSFFFFFRFLIFLFMKNLAFIKITVSQFTHPRLFFFAIFPQFYLYSIKCCIFFVIMILVLNIINYITFPTTFFEVDKT